MGKIHTENSCKPKIKVVRVEVHVLLFILIHTSGSDQWSLATSSPTTAFLLLPMSWSRRAAAADAILLKWRKQARAESYSINVN